jgi:hypothetical protein
MEQLAKYTNKDYVYIYIKLVKSLALIMLMMMINLKFTYSVLHSLTCITEQSSPSLTADTFATHTLTVSMTVAHLTFRLRDITFRSFPAHVTVTNSTTVLPMVGTKYGTNTWK